jgi:hypothetical protein
VYSMCPLILVASCSLDDDETACELRRGGGVVAF